MNPEHYPARRTYWTTTLRGTVLSADPEEAWQRRQDLELLETCLSMLPPDERFLVRRHYLDEEPLESARKELGLTRSEARTSIERALKRMKQTVKRGALRESSLPVEVRLDRGR